MSWNHPKVALQVLDLLQSLGDVCNDHQAAEQAVGRKGRWLSSDIEPNLVVGWESALRCCAKGLRAQASFISS